MKTLERRAVFFDENLRIEACRLEGVARKFPRHFHDHYVLGFLESGQRRLSCRQADYVVGPGDLLLFNPLDTHSCGQVGERPMDYRCLNIHPAAMKKMALEVTGIETLPRFARTVVSGGEVVGPLRELHGMIMKEHAMRKKMRCFAF